MINPKIIILQRILPHYREGFFKKFSIKFPGTKIFYGQPCKEESLKNAEVLDENIFVKCSNIYFDNKGKIFISKIFGKIKELKPDVVISVFNVGNLNIYILFLLKKFLKYKIILWSFGYDPAEGFNPVKRFTDKIRLYLSQKADAVIFYWEEGKKEVSKYSKKTEHYFVAPNTLDTDKLTELKIAFDKTGKEKIKTELRISEKIHFIYVGRLLEDKQIEMLLEAFSIIEKKSNECRLSIIGDGSEKNKLQKLSNELNLKNIKFLGEIFDEEETGKWIYISDAFIMPGRLGLSVVHSFCFGTPVISQRKDKYFHGEGIGYIKDGENGFLVEDGNVNELAETLTKITSDNELSGKLRQNAIDTIKNECSVEKMMSGFERAIKDLPD